MGKSKQSEEAIIKLGKTIVEELKLDESVNTLGRWMSHYVAELILQIENIETEDERQLKQKECCELILKLWKDRKQLPGSVHPIRNLEPLLELLDVFQEDKSNFRYFGQNEVIPDNPSWKNFTAILRRNSINVFDLSFYTSVNSNLLEKKQKWTEKHKSMLSEEEVRMLKHLERLVNKSKSFITFSNGEKAVTFDQLTSEKRYEAIFKKIEDELDEIQQSFKNLKEQVLGIN